MGRGVGWCGWVFWERVYVFCLVRFLGIFEVFVGCSVVVR